jgi:hypothetical protein
MDHAWHPSVRPRPGRLDSHLDRQLDEQPQPYVWHKSAEEILDALALYCQRINDSGD